METSSDKIKRFRKNRKQQIIESMGGKCQICGYCNCNSALDLHHVDPNDKDPYFSRMIARNWDWKKVEKEILKCVLLCVRCHREVHAGVSSLPENYQRFDKSLITTKREVSIPKSRKERKYKIKWDTLDWEYLLTNYKTNIELAKFLDVSDSIVSRQKRKRNLVFH